MRLPTRLTAAAVSIVAFAALAPAALASTSATLSLDQSAGTSAGGFHNLGLSLGFTNSGTDSPKNLTLNLPAGLLANTAIDNGACLKTAASDSPTAACQIGSGTVTAQPDLSIIGIGVPAPVSVPVSFYLVAPPNAGDLAGLEVYSSSLGEQLGSTGDIVIRPSGNPLGVGASIDLTLPDTLTLTLPIIGKVNAAPISITSIVSTLNSLRYPATCPGSAAAFTASVNSYSSPGSVQSLSAPLAVSACSSLPYSPAFAVSAVKDTADKGVTLTTTVTQAATEAPNRSVSLSFPTAVLGPNAITGLGNLCRSASVASCTPVGSVSATSPLYPSTLTGKAYLTGTSTGLTLTLVFPAPFPLTLTGTVNLVTDTASFAGLPDIPLSNLGVTLNGGPKALFLTDCLTPSGTATASLVDQNGDRSRTVPASFTVSHCTAPPPPPVGTPGSGAGTPGGTGGSGGSGSGGSSGGTSSTGGTTVTARSVTGLAKGRPRITFRVVVSRKRPKLTSLQVKLPKDLSLRLHKHSVRGVRLTGAKAHRVRRIHGRLVIVLRRPTRRVTVSLGPAALRESKALRRAASSRKLKRLVLHVTTRDTHHKRHALTVTVTKQHLS